MHSVDVEEVGLPSPLLAEGQVVDCVISATFGLGEKFKSRQRQLQLHRFSLTSPPVKQRPMTGVQHGGTKTASVKGSSGQDRTRLISSVDLCSWQGQDYRNYV